MLAAKGQRRGRVRLREHLVEVRPGELGEVFRRDGPRVRRSRRDEPVAGSGKPLEHRRCELAPERRGDDGVVVALEAPEQPLDALDVVRAVPDLLAVPLEPAGELDLDVGRDRAAEERLGRFASL